MALGVAETCIYREQSRTRLSKGQVILLGTDGVWEASNLRGEMFGKKRVYEAIRIHHHRSAREILDAILWAQDAFQGGARKADDATLVLIKIQT
jgi:sigma-B regulation protein RsbU (phosphoserine phosphatase)